MTKLSLLIAVAATAAVASAQTTSSTLPSGFDTTRGDGAVFAGFDVRLSATSTTTYNPSRALYFYDSSLIPANLQSKPITDISFRRDATFIAAATDAHTKKVFLRMSTTSNGAAEFANMQGWDDNHGTNVIDVFGTASAPKDVSFPATAAPGAGMVAAWNVNIKLDRPFLLRANETFVLEMRTYSTSVAAGIAARFRADGKIYPGTGYSSGISIINTEHCLDPRTFYSNRVWRPGSEAGVFWRTGRARVMPGVAWIGSAFPTPIDIPNTGGGANNLPLCRLAVSLDVLSPAVSNSEGAFYFAWGRIPANPVWIGTQVPHQALFIDSSANTLGIGLTRGLINTVANGYDSAVTKVGALYSYGGNTTKYDGNQVDPNTEPMPRYHFRRVPIIKVN